MHSIHIHHFQKLSKKLANKPKIGLEYFPLEVSLFSDIKVRKLIRYQSGKAVSIYLHLLCNIYKNGYYMLWDSELPFVISESLGYEEGYINEVIQCCLNIDLFSKKMFDENKCLTSKGIQERYKQVCFLAKRKSIISEYSLIISDNNAIPSEQLVINTEELPQSKEKESKEKEREGEKLPHARKVFSESTYFEKEKFLNARPAGAALWSTVPIHAKEILYTEILAWSHNTHAWRDDDGWILEAYKWYSRNPEKYKVKEAKTIPFKNGASDEIKKAREGLKVFQTN